MASPSSGLAGRPHHGPPRGACGFRHRGSRAPTAQALERHALREIRKSSNDARPRRPIGEGRSPRIGSAALAYGGLGMLLGMVLGATGGQARRSSRAAIAAGVTGLILGGAAGTGDHTRPVTLVSQARAAATDEDRQQRPGPGPADPWRHLAGRRGCGRVSRSESDSAAGRGWSEPSSGASWGPASRPRSTSSAGPSCSRSPRPSGRWPLMRPPAPGSPERGTLRGGRCAAGRRSSDAPPRQPRSASGPPAIPERWLRSIAHTSRSILGHGLESTGDDICVDDIPAAASIVASS